MKKIIALAAIAAATSGCATVLNDSTQPLRVDTKGADGQLIAGADCNWTNDKGSGNFKSGTTVNVRRSSKDLDLTCTLPSEKPAQGRAISRANGGMWGNVLLGGVVGAVVDHSKGTAYTYPTWVQLAFGQLLTFDRHDEHGGKPVAADGAAPMPATQPVLQATAQHQQPTAVAAAGNSPAERAQSVSNHLQCGAVNAQTTSSGRSVFVATCPSGGTVTIDCSGFGCKTTSIQ